MKIAIAADPRGFELLIERLWKAAGAVDRGIVLCGSGVEASVAGGITTRSACSERSAVLRQPTSWPGVTL
jgi:hypothetical protein